MLFLNLFDIWQNYIFYIRLLLEIYNVCIDGRIISIWEMRQKFKNTLIFIILMTKLDWRRKLCLRLMKII